MAGAIIDADLIPSIRYGGRGYVSAKFPVALVTDSGSPCVARLLLIARNECDIFRKTLSAADGTYVFHGVDETIIVDVVGRDLSNTYNDVIWSRVKPYPYDVKTLTGSFTVGALNSLAGALELYGGEDHVVSTSGSPPPGITFDVEWGEAPDFDHAGAWVTASGTTTSGSYSWDLTVTAKNGTAKTVSLTLVVP